jgi:hypothetical protein
MAVGEGGVDGRRGGVDEEYGVVVVVEVPGGVPLLVLLAMAMAMGWVLGARRLRALARRAFGGGEAAVLGVWAGQSRTGGSAVSMGLMSGGEEGYGPGCATSSVSSKSVAVIGDRIDTSLTSMAGW